MLTQFNKNLFLLNKMSNLLESAKTAIRAAPIHSACVIFIIIGIIGLIPSGIIYYIYHKKENKTDKDKKMEKDSKISSLVFGSILALSILILVVLVMKDYFTSNQQIFE